MRDDFALNKFNTKRERRSHEDTYYTFDKLSEVTERFLKEKGFERYGLFVQDYGGRLPDCHPQARGLGLAHHPEHQRLRDRLHGCLGGLRNALWKSRTPETEQGIAGLLEFETVNTVYLHGHKRPELISPDNWNMDFWFIERPNARRVQLDLFYDYSTNVDLYPQWQKFLPERQPKTLIFWGQNDIFFTREGGEAFLHDLPDAEMHRLDSGHFAVEDSLDTIASNIRRFYDVKVSSVSQPAASRKAVR